MLGIGGDSAARPAGREHIPVYPFFFRILRGLQLAVGLIVLGLDAYGLSVLDFSGDELMMFTCIATVIVCIYSIVANLAAPAAFNYWAVLSLDIFLTVFWLISFALLASQVAPFMGSYSCAYGYCVSYSLNGGALVYANCLAAAAGLGGLNFLLFAVTVVVNGLAIHAHRQQGLHSMPGQPASAPAGGDAAEKAAAAAAGTVPVQPVGSPPPQDPYYVQQAAAGYPVGTYPAGTYPAGTYPSVSSVSPVSPEQAAQQQQLQQQQFYAAQTITPPPQQPTPLSYEQPQQAPIDPNAAAAYYAAQQQQQQQQFPVQQQQQPYYEVGAAPVQPVQPEQPVQPVHAVQPQQ